MENETTQHNTIQYNIYICNTNNVCQLAESEARAVTGGTRQG